MDAPRAIRSAKSYCSGAMCSFSTSNRELRTRSRLGIAFARWWPERVLGLFFFNCPYPGIGRRWAEPDSVPEIWYQSFNALPWSAELVGSSREACRLYIGHFLRHWAANPRAFDEDLETWIDNFMKPGNLQGGFNWYISTNESRIKQIRHGPPELSCSLSDIPDPDNHM
jgi:hypothetical protein